MKTRHFLSITDVTDRELLEILSIAGKLKKQLKKTGKNRSVFANKMLVMIFEKPSLRTRVSFEVGMTQLGGHAIYLAPADIGLGKREPVSDASRVLSSMGDMIMARVFDHQTVIDLAESSAVPVINGLSDLEHPCQILADLLTMLEVKKKLKGLAVAFVGDGENNVTHSLALACGLLGMHFRVAAPRGYQMKKEVVLAAQRLAKASGGTVIETGDPTVAVRSADVVYTDTWVSMGDESQKKERLKMFSPYRVTGKLMAMAKTDAIFMHDMPAYRGNEVTSEVIDGSKSVIFAQAENRLHAQKGLMVWLLRKNI